MFELEPEAETFLIPPAGALSVSPVVVAGFFVLVVVAFTATGFFSAVIDATEPFDNTDDAARTPLAGFASFTKSSTVSDGFVFVLLFATLAATSPLLFPLLTPVSVVKVLAFVPPFTTAASISALSMLLDAASMCSPATPATPQPPPDFFGRPRRAATRSTIDILCTEDKLFRKVSAGMYDADLFTSYILTFM